MSWIKEVKWIALCILRNAERSVLSDHSRDKQQPTAKQRWPLMKCQIWKPNWDALKHEFNEGLGLKKSNSADGSVGSESIAF